MFRLTVKSLRTPMIQFRYGVREAVAPAAVAATPAAATAATPAAPAAANPVLDSVWDLPPNLRPKIITEAEMTAVRFGGASPYPVDKKKKK